MGDGAVAGGSSDDVTGDFSSPPSDGTTEPVEPGLVVPQRSRAALGPYKLLQQIGEGGMGAVFMAEQHKPVRRRVAIKIIKPGMDSSQVIARFEAERQALAMMDHPNIARVFDAGTTAEGRPYFVMELVQGVPITDYCDRARLTPRARLELFLPICQAIQHAHQKGIIHRDIKPSNVLVALLDGLPVPKVIDFGVAKAIDQPLTERTMFTQVGAIVGTLEYMSPEQAEMSLLGVDTRSDVYSLGVLLYELLTGSTPLDRAKLRESGYAEILKRIREEEPTKPSTRLSSFNSKDAIATISTRRGTEPAKLCRQLRGELDWIVMKALEKDRNRRYEAAGAMARDIERYLRDEPVEAGPPTATYRLGKLARRHRAALFTAGAFAGVLMVAAAAGTYLAVRARAAERRATAANIQTQAALEQSETARAEAEAVARFLVEAFRTPDPAQSGRDVKVADVLDRAATGLEAEFAGNPRAKARLLKALGQTYIGLGIPGRAVDVLTSATVVSEATLGAEHPDTLATRSELGEAYSQARRFDDAIAIFERTIEQQSVVLGPDHPDTLSSQNGLGATLVLHHQTAKGIKLLEQVLKKRAAALGNDHPDTLRTRQYLALGFLLDGRVSEAIPQLEENMRLSTERLGPDQPETIQRSIDLAHAYGKAGRWEDAIKLGEAIIPRLVAKLGPEHPRTLLNLNNLAESYRRSGRPDEAIKRAEKALDGTIRTLGADHLIVPDFRDTLAEAHYDAGHVDQAIALHGENVRFSTAKLGPNQPETLDSRSKLARSLDFARRHAEAETHWRELLDRSRKLSEPDEPLIATALAGLGANLLGQGRAGDAEPLLRESLALRERIEPEAWTTFDTRSLRGAALLALGKRTAAEPLLRSGYEGLKIRTDQVPLAARVRIAEARERLAALDRGPDNLTNHGDGKAQAATNAPKAPK